MEEDDKRKKKIWKKKTKQVKSSTDHPSFSSENKDSVDQNHLAGSTNESCGSKAPGDLNQPNISRNEHVSVHGNDGEVWMEKQAAMEAIIADLQNQKDLLSQKEKVNKKLLDSLQADNSRLYLQIKELEKSQSYLLGENEQLSEKISNMQSQIQNLERIISSNNFSTESLEVNESGVDSGLPTQVLKSEFEIPTPDHDQRSRDTAPEPGIEDMESQMGEVVVDRRVPLSHAPLIGAPFRLISFVAGYVSGADLLTIQ